MIQEYFLKECKSLSKKYEVHLINKDFDGNKDNIVFIKARFLKNVFSNYIKLVNRFMVYYW